MRLPYRPPGHFCVRSDAEMSLRPVRTAIRWHEPQSDRTNRNPAAPPPLWGVVRHSYVGGPCTSHRDTPVTCHALGRCAVARVSGLSRVRAFLVGNGRSALGRRFHGGGVHGAERMARHPARLSADSATQPQGTRHTVRRPHTAPWFLSSRCPRPPATPCAVVLGTGASGLGLVPRVRLGKSTARGLPPLTVGSGLL